MGCFHSKYLSMGISPVSEMNKFCDFVQIFLESLSYLQEKNIPSENIWL